MATLFRTIANIRSLHSQYPKVEYVDAEGVVRTHIFDRFLVLSDGIRVAVAVKEARKRAMMLDLFERICANGITGVGPNGKRTPGVADAVALMTDEEATLEAFENAFFVISSREHHDEAECRALVDIVSRLPGRFRFGDLLRDVPSRRKRRTAVWRLIDLGVVEPVFVGRIDELSWLRFAA